MSLLELMTSLPHAPPTEWQDQLENYVKVLGDPKQEVQFRNVVMTLLEGMVKTGLVPRELCRKSDLQTCSGQ